MQPTESVHSQLSPMPSGRFTEERGPAVRLTPSWSDQEWTPCFFKERLAVIPPAYFLPFILAYVYSWGFNHYYVL